MKNKLIICLLIAGLGICSDAAAQSSSVGNGTETSRPIIIEGQKFPMSASEYAAAQKVYQQRKAEQDALKKEKEAKLIAAKTNNADAATITVTNTAAKTNVAPATKVTNKVPDDENPVVPAKQQTQQPVTKQEVKPVEIQKPQVPEQFKLPANQKWDGKPVPANNVETKASTELPKVPQVSTTQNEPAKKAGS